LIIEKHDEINDAVLILKTIFAPKLWQLTFNWLTNLTDENAKEVEIDKDISVKIIVEKQVVGYVIRPKKGNKKLLFSARISLKENNLKPYYYGRKNQIFG
jgi:CRISPR/Cas system-associated protein Csm6